MCRWIVGVVICFIFHSCANSVVKKEFAQNVDFSKFSSYAWLPSFETDSIRYYKFKNNVAVSDLKDVVSKELNSRGYNLNNENPDFLVLLRTSFTERLDTVPVTPEAITIPPSTGFYIYDPANHSGNLSSEYYRGFSTLVYINEEGFEIVPFTEGSITIDLIETKNKTLLWRGTATRPIDYDEEKVDLKKDIQRIFNKTFPIEEKK